ncbi:MAG: polysaccharide biosynthesis/export family protein [Candidatus Hydrogenedentes bacterium]|nr:polysaccharide biosynthesis/export family protein [Candidatus Hydrogenedentota bacterium]MBI3117812.1 polysaccharide biosynthesis/export family protein [Candidatus Hydrogenedentota bacterium]
MKTVQALGLCCSLLALALFGAGCATSGAAGDGIIMVGENGEDKPVTPSEVDGVSGLDRPYYVQVGDVLDVSFAIRAMRAGEVPWDYRIEVGDSMEIAFTPGTLEPGTYKIQTGDVLGISFLDNWQLNVTRTVRPDGMISAPEVGDVLARNRSALELRDDLKRVYTESGIIEGEPRITVNVDFVNLDRYGDISRDVVVRPDGGIRLPGIPVDMRIGGMTITEASDLLQGEAAKILNNNPQVGILVFPAVATNVLAEMNGPVQVRPDGRVSINRLGEVQAAGFSVDELQHVLAKTSEGIIHNPVEPSVDILKATGGRIYVGGEVKTPGVYPLEGAPSAIQAVLTANGFNNDSRLNNVIVMRRNPNGKPYVFKTNLRVALTEGHTENDILLRPFDVVYVPKKTVSKLNLFVEQYIDKMVPFDNSLGVNAQYYLNEQQVDTRSRNINFSTGITGIMDVLNP